MENHYKLSDSNFIQQIIKCELNPSDFTHEAHLRLAWINIYQFGIDEAVDIIQSQLQNFIEFVGAKDKYNKTLTVAAIKAVNHFMLKSESHDFREFMIEFPRFKTNFKELMSSHYSFDIYNSDQAKKVFLKPDLLPFD